MEVSTKDAIRTIDNWVTDICNLFKEIEEVQVAFNGDLIRSSKEFQQKIVETMMVIYKDINSIPSEIRKIINKKHDEEETKIQKRISELKASTTNLQNASDDYEKTSETILKSLTQANPEINEKEEVLKLQVKETLVDIKTTERELARYDGIKGWFAGDKVKNLKKSFGVGLKKLQNLSSELETIRNEWKKKLTESETKVNEEKEAWMKVQHQLTDEKIELSNLEKNHENMTMYESVAILIKDDIPKGLSSNIESTLTKAKQLQWYVDEIRKELVDVATILGTLKGIMSGFEKMRKSFVGLWEEENMHSELSRLSFDFPETILKYHDVWKEVTQKIIDEKNLCECPSDFAKAVQVLIKDNLSKDKIEWMFTEIGASIQAATKSWSA